MGSLMVEHSMCMWEALMRLLVFADVRWLKGRPAARQACGSDETISTRLTYTRDVIVTITFSWLLLATVCVFPSKKSAGCRNASDSLTHSAHSLTQLTSDQDGSNYYHISI